MPQAILTYYMGPTDYRGSRIKAKAQAGSVVLSWDDALNAEANHRLAAKALAEKFGWIGVFACGHLPDGSSVYVNAQDFGAGFSTQQEG